MYRHMKCLSEIDRKVVKIFDNINDMKIILLFKWLNKKYKNYLQSEYFR